jgi:hypothetical protein
MSVYKLTEDLNMYTNITTINRVSRVALSIALVMAVVNMTGPLGVLTVMPFISIYAGITGFIGWDPIAALLNQIEVKAADKDFAGRYGLATH